MPCGQDTNMGKTHIDWRPIWAGDPYGQEVETLFESLERLSTRNKTVKARAQLEASGKASGDSF